MNNKIDILFQKMDKLKKDIESGEVSERDIPSHLRAMSQHDYRTSEQMTIDNFVDTFLTGCKRVVDVDSRKITAINSVTKEEVKDIDYYAEQFIQQDFIKIQKPFWQEYKKQYSVTNKDAVSSKRIYDACKKAKDRLK